MTIACRKCQSKKTTVYGGKVLQGNQYRRYRRCKDCGCRFVTVEKLFEADSDSENTDKESQDIE